MGSRTMGYAASMVWLGMIADEPSRAASAALGSSCAGPQVQGESRPPACGAGSRGKLLAVLPLHRYSQEGLEDYWDAWLGGVAALGYIEDTVDPGVQNGAETFKVTYCTVDFDGTPLVASGLLAIPRTGAAAPTVIYSHGTAVTRLDTPSNPDVDATFDGPTGMVVFAGHGYIYLAPDLTGFGDSSAPRHRYLHAQTAARSSLDMLVAVERHTLYRIASDGRLFNSGYSQGGHTALAFAAVAEEAGVDITATSVGGAMTNPDAWFGPALDQAGSSYQQVYPADIIISYNDVYADIYEHPSDVFASPFDVTLDGMFDMSHTYEEVIAAMPTSLAEMLAPAFFDEAHASSSPIRVHLRENAVDGVCLSSPIRMVHMLDDDEVPYELALDGLAKLSDCNEVELLTVLGESHLQTWHETLPGVRDWFDTF
jgi:hypothetical protein